MHIVAHAICAVTSLLQYPDVVSDVLADAVRTATVVTTARTLGLQKKFRISSKNTTTGDCMTSMCKHASPEPGLFDSICFYFVAVGRK